MNERTGHPMPAGFVYEHQIVGETTGPGDTLRFDLARADYQDGQGEALTPGTRVVIWRGDTPATLSRCSAEVTEVNGVEATAQITQTDIGADWPAWKDPFGAGSFVYWANPSEPESYQPDWDKTATVAEMEEMRIRALQHERDSGVGTGFAGVSVTDSDPENDGDSLRRHIGGTGRVILDPEQLAALE